MYTSTRKHGIILAHKSQKYRGKTFFPLSGWKDSVRICILMRCLLLANWICYATEQLRYWLSDSFCNFHHQAEEGRIRDEMMLSSCIITYNALLFRTQRKPKIESSFVQDEASAAHIDFCWHTQYQVIAHYYYPWIRLESLHISLTLPRAHFLLHFFCIRFFMYIDKLAEINDPPFTFKLWLLPLVLKIESFWSCFLAAGSGLFWSPWASEKASSFVSEYKRQKLCWSLIKFNSSWGLPIQFAH